MSSRANFAFAGNVERPRQRAPTLRHRQQQHQEQSRESPIPDWVYFVLAVLADLIVVAGLIPASRVAVVRSLVMFALYREWMLAAATGFLLPRVVPLTLVCYGRSRWLAFRKDAEERLRSLAAAAAQNAAPTNVDNSPRGEAEGFPAGRAPGGRESRPRPGECSGYDVSGVSGEEVVELSSWAQSKSSKREEPGIRRRPIS